MYRTCDPERVPPSKQPASTSRRESGLYSLVKFNVISPFSQGQRTLHVTGHLYGPDQENLRHSVKLIIHVLLQCIGNHTERWHFDLWHHDESLFFLFSVDGKTIIHFSSPPVLRRLRLTISRTLTLSRLLPSLERPLGLTARTLLT